MMWAAWITVGIVVGVIATFLAVRSERTNLARQFRDTVQKLTAVNAESRDISIRAQQAAAAEKARGDEWKATAEHREKRIKELTDRLLRAARIPSLDDENAEDSPTVAQADAAAAAEARALTMREPLRVTDDSVAPVPRLDMEDEAGDEESDGG